jgi:hypothetical protein
MHRIEPSPRDSLWVGSGQSDTVGAQDDILPGPQSDDLPAMVTLSERKVTFFGRKVTLSAIYPHDSVTCVNTPAPNLGRLT